METAAHTRVAAVQKQREAAALRWRLKAAGLQEQTDGAVAEEMLAAKERANASDWKALASALDEASSKY